MVHRLSLREAAIFFFLAFSCWIGDSAYAAIDLVGPEPAVQGRVLDLAVDSSGNQYVVGDFSGGNDFNPQVGIDSKQASGASVFVTRFDADGSYAWTQVFGDSATGGANSTAIAVSGSSVYVTGTISGSGLTIGGSGSISSLGSSDAFVLALDATTGAALSAFSGDGLQLFGGSSVGAIGFDLAEAGGVLYVAGDFQGSDAGIGASGTISSSAGNDAFILALDASSGAAVGTFNTTGVVTLGGSGSEIATGICISGGVAYVCGHFDSSNTGINGMGSLQSAGGADVFILALNATTGTPVTAFSGDAIQTFGGTADDGAFRGVKVGANTNTVFVTGYFESGDASIGGSGSYTFDDGDLFVLAIDKASGNPRSGFADAGFQSIGPPDDGPNAPSNILATDDALYVVGLFSGENNLEVSSRFSGNERNGLVAALNPDTGALLPKFVGGSGIQVLMGSASIDYVNGVALFGDELWIAGESTSANAGLGALGSWDLSSFGGFLIKLNAETGGPKAVVTNKNDSGAGSLRQALIDAVPGSFITFDDTVFDPANGTAATTIIPATEFPALADGSVTIDAQNHRVKLDGAAIGGFSCGLRITSDNNVVMGLTVSRFGRAGICVESGAANNTLGGDRTVGTGPNGQGLRVTDNLFNGIEITDGAHDNKVVGAWLGIDEAGTAPEPNQTGLVISGAATDNTVGSVAPGEINIIGGNDQAGIEIFDAGTKRNRFFRNFVGARLPPGTPLPSTLTLARRRGAVTLVDTIGNGLSGIHFSNGTQENLVGSDNDGNDDEFEGNLIGFNGDDATGFDEGYGLVVIDSTTSQNTASKNATVANRRAGIFLGTGGNGGILPPVIASVNQLSPPSGGLVNLQIQGTAAGSAGGFVEVFSTDVVKEGETFVGRVQVNGSGNWELTEDVEEGKKLSATVTDTDGNTSAFTSFDPGVPGGGGGSGTVGDGALLLTKGKFAVNWKVHNASGEPKDTLSLSGIVNPAGMPTVLPAGTTMRVSMNGVDLADGAFGLDAKGKGGGVASDNSVFKSAFKAKNGAFTFSLKGADLRTVLDEVTDVSETDTTIAAVEVEVLNAGLDTELLSGNPQFRYVTKAGISSKGLFALKSDRLTSGIFLISKASSVQQKAGGQKVKASGFLSGDGGGTVSPTGSITLTVGDEPSLVIPFSAFQQSGGGEASSFSLKKGSVAGLSAFSFSNAKKTFLFVTDALQNTGIPDAGTGGTGHELTVHLDIVTGQGTRSFETTIELLRKSATSGKWKR